MQLYRSYDFAKIDAELALDTCQKKYCNLWTLKLSEEEGVCYINIRRKFLDSSEISSENFTIFVHLFTGGWYDIEKTFFAGQMDKTCVKAVYTLRPDGKIDVLNEDLTADGYQENTTGTAYYKDQTDRSKLTVQLGTSPEANYWVVETDYETYALIWSCTDLVGFAHADIVWILGRKQTLDDSIKQKLKNKLTSLGLQYGEFYPTTQNKCPW